MSSVPPVGKKTGIPDFPFPSPLRAQIKAGELCLGTNTPATADLRVVATICQRDIDWLWIDCEHGWASSVEGVGGKSIHVLPTRVLHPTPPHPTISLRLTGPACCPQRRASWPARAGSRRSSAWPGMTRPSSRKPWTWAPCAALPPSEPSSSRSPSTAAQVGVMIPQVQNAEEAKAAVDAARYFPEGMRGISPPWTGLAGMGMDGPVLEKIQEETVVMVQLEVPPPHP